MSEYTAEEKARVDEIIARQDKLNAEILERQQKADELEKKRKAAIPHAIAFTFAEGREWQLLTTPAETIFVRTPESGPHLALRGIGRAKAFIPAAIILDDGKLYDNVLCAYDFQFGPEFSNKERLLKILDSIKERITNEYPGPRRGPEGL